MSTIKQTQENGLGNNLSGLYISIPQDLLNYSNNAEQGRCGVGA
jgi:hypothetical protein